MNPICIAFYPAKALVHDLCSRGRGPYELAPLGRKRNFLPVARRLYATITSGESASASDISEE
jgi:hypothetical protein